MSRVTEHTVDDFRDIGCVVDYVQIPEVSSQRVPIISKHRFGVQQFYFPTCNIDALIDEDLLVRNSLKFPLPESAFNYLSEGGSAFIEYDNLNQKQTIGFVSSLAAVTVGTLCTAGMDLPAALGLTTVCALPAGYIADDKPPFLHLLSTNGSNQRLVREMNQLAYDNMMNRRYDHALADGCVIATRYEKPACAESDW